jgi:predicted metal-dependent phosphoesterase TrpH
MQVDLHFHAVLSKKIGFEPAFFQESVRQARRVGLDALAMTNHFNTPNFEGVYAYLDREYIYTGSYYDVDGVRLYPGIEVNVREGPHVVVLGEREAILAYHARFRHNMTPETYCSAHEVFDRQEGLRLLTVLAHPLRPGREITRIGARLYSRFHALELNARDLVLVGREIAARTERVAWEYGLPMIAGSDTHHYHQLGSVYNRFEPVFGSVIELADRIARGEYAVQIDGRIDRRVLRARTAKEALKRAKLGIAPLV